MSKLARVSFVLFFVLMLGNVTHMIGSGLFVIGMLILAVLLGADYYSKKLSPAAKAAKASANELRDASLSLVLTGDQGVLYVYREGSSLGAGLAQAAPDALAAVDLRPMCFTRWVLPAGDHTLRAGVKGTNKFAENLGGQTVCLRLRRERRSISG